MFDPKQQGGFNWQDLFTMAQEGQQGNSSGSASGGSRGPQSPEFEVLKNRLARMGKRGFIALIVVVLIVAAVCYWWFHPPINIHSADLWYFMGIFILLPSFIVFFTYRQIYQHGAGKREKSEKKSKLFKYLMFVPVAIALVGVLGWVTSLSLFPGNAERYANILQTTEGNFAEDIAEVDYSQIPFIDRDSAILLGNRTMGTMADYVSQFEISPLYSQINYHDAPVRVSPLEYADFFKWWSNKETGIPAYVMVNMSTQDTQIVRLENPIYYVDSDPFFKNVDRHVQLKYPFYMFEEKSFEVDEEGNPYWIFPVQDRTIGLFGGTTIQRVVLCNASTGETQDLAIDEVPQWIDRAYPAELLIEQYNWSGLLSGGWLNSVFGQNGVRQTTPGTNGQLGYNYIAQDDDVWVYSGVTSATADNSIIGFVLINQRTAESKFFPVAGATETSAMNSAEGQVQQMQYVATFPLLLNVQGQPTYFMALKDNAGLVKMYAMVDIQRYQNVAVGNTLEETERNYQTLLRQTGIVTDGDSGEAPTASGTTVTGRIASMTPVVLEGTTHFYLLLEGSDTIYDVNVASVIDVVRYQTGSEVTLTTDGSTGSVVAVSAITATTSDTSGTTASGSTEAGTEAATVPEQST